VLVVVIAVRSVSAAIVDVVDMITVRDRDMPAALAVSVAMALMHGMFAGPLAFVVVTVVRSMKMTVVHIVDVITVGDRNMPAPFAMDMVMADMFAMCGGHLFLPNHCDR
jgi:hypothetical protein